MQGFLFLVVAQKTRNVNGSVLGSLRSFAFRDLTG